VRAVRSPNDVTLVTLEHECALPAANIPDARRAVKGRCDHCAAIRTEGGACHLLRVADHREQLLTCSDVPEYRLLVVGRGGEGAPVWTERQVGHIPDMSS